MRTERFSMGTDKKLYEGREEDIPMKEREWARLSRQQEGTKKTAQSTVENIR